jgi:hypothetical protein
MTFKKNLLVVLISTAFIVLCAYLTKMSQDTLMYGLFIWIAGSVASLLFEDGIRKWKTQPELLTWQYYPGAALVLLADLAFLWTMETTEMMEFLAHLGIAVFFGFLGVIWFYIPYKESVMDAEDREADRWRKTVAKISKAKNADKSKIVAKNLRYYLVGDRLDSNLDFDRPLAYYDGICMTVSELAEVEDEAVADIEEAAVAYIATLLHQEV